MNETITSAGRVIEVFNEARNLAAGLEREAFLNEMCGGDANLREEVEQLLGADGEAQGFLTVETGGAAAPATSFAEFTPEQPGERIGRYKLLQEIGEGGFGTVWMAEQIEPVSRRVALKIIKAGMDTREVIARFEAERQALAMMDHPNIAKVFDAGATDKGRPYFVMELVKGVPVTKYCDDEHRGTRERLVLFADVCSAINHAHQKGVIHRDIKPSNVMITMHGDKPVVKVIDFGIAKATQGKLTDKTLFTRFEQFIGTPVYMSPEQAATSGLDIDTRSDIYSLGILLYELLTGKPPFDAKTLASAGYEEMRRIIREVEPPKPSSRLSTVAGEERTTLAKARQINPDKLSRLVEPDLDWIVMKAIEKDRTRRYETANGLALDIGRFLADEPVSATPPSAAYKFRKFARRNKTALRMAAGIAALLVAASTVSTWQAIRATQAEKKTAAERDAKEVARRDATAAEKLAKDRLAEVAAERDAKEEARKDAEAISTFLSDIFQSPDPERDGREIKVAELLDTAAQKLKTDLTGQPRQRARLQSVLASTFDALGLPREAVVLEEKVLEYYQSAFGPEDRRTLAVMHNLASSLRSAGRVEEALKLQEEVLALCRKVHGPEHPDTLQAVTNLANSYHRTGRLGEALKMREEVLPLFRKVRGPEHPETLKAASNLAHSLFDAGRLDEALEIREEVLSLYRKVLSPGHPATLRAMEDLSFSREAAGQLEEALRMREEALEARRRVSGPKHPDTLRAMGYLAGSYADADRVDEAIALQEEALAGFRASGEPGHPDTLDAMHNLANYYKAAGRKDEALRMRGELLELRRKFSGPEHPHTLMNMQNLANSLDDAGRMDDALKMREEALALYRKVRGPGHAETLGVMTTLAIAWHQAGRLPEAVKLQEEALAIMRRVLRPTHSYFVMAMNHMADLYDETGREEAARTLRNELAALKAKPLPPVIASLVPPDAEWKWLHSTGGTDPAEHDPDFHTTFFSPAYDDSSWQSGKDSTAPNGGFGYGRGFTGVDIGQPENESRRCTAYFRHRFTTDKTHTSLELRCQRDDAIIVYLDGSEVLRENLPEGPDAYALFASQPQGSDNDGVIHRFPLPGTLSAGGHLIAISLHNAKAPSSDLRIGGITLVEASAEISPKQDRGKETSGSTGSKIDPGPAKR